MSYFHAVLKSHPSDKEPGSNTTSGPVMLSPFAQFTLSGANGLRVNSAKHLTLLFPGGRVQSEILRSAQNDTRSCFSLRKLLCLWEGYRPHTDPFGGERYHSSGLSGSCACGVWGLKGSEKAFQVRQEFGSGESVNRAVINGERHGHCGTPKQFAIPASYWLLSDAPHREDTGLRR